MKKRKMNLPVNYQLDESTFDSERFLKLKMKVMHSGLNLNNSYFSSEVIEKAKPTLSNIPILAFVKKEDGSDEQDFAGHEFEIKITENDLEFVYLGRPIGIIPETSNYTIEEDEDGRNFVVVDGYVWKNYANSALDIIARDEVKKISMEVLVQDYEWEDSYIKILDYSYIGIAMLGDDIAEGMIGARAEVINYSKDAIFSIMSELKEALEGGKNNMADNTDVEMVVEEEEQEENTELQNMDLDIEEQEEIQEEQNEEEVVEEEFTEKEQELIQKIEELQESFEVLQQEKESLENIITEYQNKEKQNAIDELFKDFSDLEENEEAQKIYEDALNLDLDQIELQLYALRGKTLSFAKDEEEEKEESWEKLLHSYASFNTQGAPEWASIVERHRKRGDNE